MRRLIYFAIVFNLFLFFMPVKSYCQEADSKYEVEWDFMKPYNHKSDIDTVSLHILEKITESKNRSVYRGFTITRPHGYFENKESSAVGVGPTYMMRNEVCRSGKLSAAVDLSGGIMVYDKVFPAGGRHYDFMWRVGPKLIYKANKNSSINVGYTFMHVSNGFKTHNPGYDAYGVTVGFETKF